MLQDGTTEAASIAFCSYHHSMLCCGVSGIRHSFTFTHTLVIFFVVCKCCLLLFDLLQCICVYFVCCYVVDYQLTDFEIWTSLTYYNGGTPDWSSFYRCGSHAVAVINSTNVTCLAVSETVY